MNTTLPDAGAAPAGQPARAFPTQETNLARILSDPQYRKTFHAQLKRYNPVIVALYRIGLLPLIGAGRTIMLLTTRGNKSGKLRTTPIGYFKIGGDIYLFSAWGKGTVWYKNIMAHPGEVWIQIGMRKRRVQAQTLEDPVEIRRVLEQLITESPSQAGHLLGWDAVRDRLDHADFSSIINYVLIVKFIDVEK